MIALSMAKEMRFHKNHQEAERYVLEQGFKRTHEERILWLLNHMRTMQKLNPTQREMKGFVLKRKNG